MKPLPLWVSGLIVLAYSFLMGAPQFGLFAHGSAIEKWFQFGAWILAGVGTFLGVAIGQRPATPTLTLVQPESK